MRLYLSTMLFHPFSSGYYQSYVITTVSFGPIRTKMEHLSKFTSTNYGNFSLNSQIIMIPTVTFLHRKTWQHPSNVLSKQLCKLQTTSDTYLHIHPERHQRIQESVCYWWSSYGTYDTLGRRVLDIRNSDEGRFPSAGWSVVFRACETFVVIQIYEHTQRCWLWNSYKYLSQKRFIKYQAENFTEMHSLIKYCLGASHFLE